MRARTMTIYGALALVTCGTSSFAQTAEPAPAPSEAPATDDSAAEPPEPPNPPLPPDVVQLLDGSLFRGTISEYVAGSHVVIQTALGARRIDAAKLRYAGPASAMPMPERAAAPRSAKPVSESGPANRRSDGHEQDRVTIRFESPGRVSLHVWNYAPLTRIETASPYQRQDLLCAAPCSIQVPKGVYQFALRGEGSHVQPLAQTMKLTHDTRLRGEYEDNSGMRAGGWVLVGVGGLVGTILLAYGAKNEDAGLVFGGALGAIAGIGWGLALGLSFDTATLKTVR